MRALPLTLILLFAAMIAPPSSAASAPAPLLIYAASSLTDALNQIGQAFEIHTHQPVKFSFASSGTLAKQIEAGAQADVFFSADTEWMDYLQARKLINLQSRDDLLTNRLVLIAPTDSQLHLKITQAFPLAAALGTGHLSTGDPDSVPVGKYARTALINLGVWNDIAPQVVRSDSARNALAFVERGEAPLGIVYATDAFTTKDVKIIDYFPAGSHPAIVYPVALTRTAHGDAGKFIDFMRSPMGKSIFIRHGFSVR